MKTNADRKRYWRTRKDPFVGFWEDVEIELINNPYVEAKTIFKNLQTRHPNTFPDGQLRTLQRRVKTWRSKICPIEESQSWMLALLQGKIDKKALSRSSISLDNEVIDTLLVCILRKPIRQRNRAIAILSSCNKIPAPTIANFLHINSKIVSGYIELFNTGGINKLLNNSRKTIKKSEDPDYKKAVFSILHAPPSSFGINRTRWEMKFIQQVMSDKNKPIAASNIRKIIKDAGYKFRKAKKVLTSNDPDYREKLEKITKILSNLGSKEKFFSIDEFGPFNIIIRGGRDLVPPNKIKTIPQWQKSKGKLIITAALELSTNQITHFYSEKKNTIEMIRLLEILLKKYASEDSIYFSWDSASWHASKMLFEKVDKINSGENRSTHNLPKVFLAPLPAGAQFLNVIESVFSGMARAIIHNSDYKSVGECKIAIDRYFEDRNHQFKKNPKRAGKKIWGKEREKAVFSESNNCKDPLYR
jgi:hypothetical protein